MNHDLKIGIKVAAVQGILGTPDEISYNTPKMYDYLYFPRVSAGDTPSSPKGEMLILSFTDDLLTQICLAR